MRSKFLMCAALAATGAFTWFGSAHAAGGKAKDKATATAKKAAAASELHADDKSMKKQLQWEDKVMGPDSKRAELDRIARASAINEKAAKDQEKAEKSEKERQAGPDAPAPKARKVDARAEIAIPPTAEERALNADRGRSVEISPKLSTEAAAAPVPRSKPADDKFIDKLLRDQGPASTKASASKSSANDRALEELLAGAKDKPAGRKPKGDKVDDLIKSADKGPAMPAPRSAAALPEWAQQPEIAPSSPPPVAVHAPAKQAKDDGVLHVVQGAAVSPAPVATRVNARKSATRPTKAPVMWNDPFADTKTVASRDRQATPAPKKEPASHPSAAPSSEWSDPFADSPETRKTMRHATTSSPAVAPASAPKRGQKSDPNGPGTGSGGWKDPFTKATTESSRAPVAMRELGKGETSKWEIATHRSASHAAPSPDSRVGAWGVLKKHK